MASVNSRPLVDNKKKKNGQQVYEEYASLVDTGELNPKVTSNHNDRFFYQPTMGSVVVKKESGRQTHSNSKGESGASLLWISVGPH